MIKFWIVICLGFALPAWAADSIFYAEPDIGYLSGKIQSTGEANGVDIDTSAGTSGVSPGLLIGWRAEYVHLLIGGHYTMLAVDAPGAKSTSQYEFGAGIGWEWNIPLMTTLMIEKISYGVTESDGRSNNLDGFGARIGLSYFLSKRFKLNVAIVTSTAQSEDVKFKSTAYTAGISFPFDINYPEYWWRDGEVGAR